MDIFTNLAKKILKLIVYSYYSVHLKLINQKPRKIVFLLAHWRSGSSLMTHILSSNSEVIGFGESKTVYYSKNNFDSLSKEIHWNLRKSKIFGSQILLDSVLMNHLLPNPDLLKTKRLYTIFLVREPNKAIPSIFNMGVSHWNCDPNHYEKEALKYYLDRLSSLEKYAKIINSKSQGFFLTYDQLVSQTELVLEKLQNFLELKSPLSENYQLTPATGKSGKGDWTDNIKSSRIIKNARSSGSGINLSQETLDRGREGFKHCCNLLSQYCRTVDD